MPERCLHTGETLEPGTQVFYIEAEGGYVIGKEEILIDFLTGQGWSREEIEETREGDELGEPEIYFTTIE